MANNRLMVLSAENKDDKKNLLGHYKLLEKLAQGGMAEIYKAETFDPSGLRREVVIKRILPHISSQQEFIDMLIDEAKIAVQFNHGNIAQIYDLGKVGNDYFIVMEYVAGKTLQQIAKRAQALQTRIPLPYCLYFIAELCAGLAYMHRKTDSEGKPLSVVHRDISPQNLIITYSGNLKIIDFGVAKASDKITITESGVLKGKFAYMSPEQAVGDEIDHRSDIFSAGIILWELVTGERLFRKKSNKETLKAVKKAEIPSVIDLCPEAPKALDKTLRKTMARAPRKRYENAEDLQMELLRILHDHYPEFKPSQAGSYVESLFRPQTQTPASLPQEQAASTHLIAPSHHADDDQTRHEKIRIQEHSEIAKKEDGPPEEVTLLARRAAAKPPIAPEKDIEVGEETMWVHRDQIDMSPVICNPEDPRDKRELEPTTAYPGDAELLPPEQENLETIIPPSDVQFGLIDKPVGKSNLPAVLSTPAEETRATSRLIWIIPLVLLTIISVGGTLLWNYFHKNHDPLDSYPVASLAILHVVVTPREATVRVDDTTLARDKDVYTANYLDPRRPHALSISQPGYSAFTQMYSLREGEEKWLDITLPEIQKPEPPKPTYGFLVVESDPPGASIFIDDKETGKVTPAIIDGLPAREAHHVGLSSKGLKYYQETFALTGGETKTISAKLESNKGSFSFITDPAGAYVRVNGELIGQSPILNYEIGPDTVVELRYTSPGFEEWGKTFKVFGGERERIFQKLNPLSEK